MRILDRSSSFWIVLLYVPLLFLPKINLVSFGNETAGIRIDDILLFFLFLLCFWARQGTPFLNTRPCPIERSLVLFVSFSLLSFSLNRIYAAFGVLSQQASFFYSLRLAEYFVFFYLGILLRPIGTLSTILKLFFSWNLLLILFQKAGWIGQFSVLGYLPVNTDRVTGIASFPSEAGLLLNMLFAWFLFSPCEDQKRGLLLPAFFSGFLRRTRLYWLFLLFLSLAALTGSRISMAAMLLLLLVRMKQEVNWRSPASWAYALLFLLVSAALSLFLVRNTEALLTRSLHLLSFKNLELFSTLWEQMNTQLDPKEDPFLMHAYDLSWWMRLHKWIYALKVYLQYPACYLQGIGPGFCGPALDGGYLRLLAENGLIGTLLFLGLLAKLYRQSPQLKGIIIALLANMLFFDAYLAYKPMSLLFLVSGYQFSDIEHKSKDVCVYL
jgi:hypothetical protein